MNKLKVTPMVLILIIVLLAFGGSCIESVRKFSPFDNRTIWQLDNFPVEAVWTKEETRVPIVLSSVPENAPKKYKLPHLVQAGNQGRQASGTAWAVGYLALSQHFRGRKKELDYICSPSFIYNQLVNGKDTGIEIVEALDFLSESGCSNNKFMPFSEMNLLQRPDARAIQDASRHQLKGFARLEFTDVSQIKAHLLQGSVVIISMMISENFVDLDDYEWEYPAGKPAGRQTLGVVGYDDDKKIFILQNSLGQDWGEQGQVTISYNWFLRLTHKAYVLW